VKRATVRRFAGPVLRRRAALRYRSGPLRHRYPRTPEELRASALARTWWYYSMELLPGEVVDGQYPPELPLLPRVMLRRCRVEGASCLDLGTVEGLIPVLLARRGARDVLAVDYSNHCVGKLAAVRHYHGVEFDYRTVGLMYRLHRQIRRRSFDLVNVSGLLYHVFSPLGVLGAVRPLVKRNGLVIVSTNVTLDPGYTMDFNAGGRLQREANTFWYPTVQLLDYMLRYMRLVPIDCLHLPHELSPLREDFVFDKRSGYVSVLCRAVDDPDPDDWMRESMATSWEHLEGSDWPRAGGAPESAIEYAGERDGGRIDLAAAVGATPPLARAESEADSHLLRLGATA
jgi:2-polyprenyl-3-methyl-5-hydroxy-6-metoxy-1,4-benzoquinol methylase